MSKEWQLKDYFTKAQKSAIQTQKPRVCVTACAGSGKTSVLVERYVRLVLEGKIGLNQILAITFTDKAANEMRERLMHRFSELECPLHIRQLEGAMIGTIHHFCKDLLQTFPLEAGLASDFSVLDTGEVQILKKRALDRVFGNLDVDMYSDFLSLYGYANIRKWLVHVYDEVQTYGAKIEDVLREIPHQKYYERAISRLRNTLLDLEGDVKKGGRSFPTKKQEAFGVLLAFSGLSFEEASKDDCFYSMLKAKKGFGTSKAEAYQERFTIVQEELERIAGLILTQNHQHFKKQFVQLLFYFSEYYKQFKRESQALDFDDLLVETSQLVCSDSPLSTAVFEYLTKRFRFVLVDEFQDTNQIQTELVDKLTEISHLFLVGDPRQSIYGFRGAIVSNMHQKIEAFRSEAEEEAEVIPLDQNHRSTRGLIEAINKAFQWMSGVTQETFETMRSELENPNIKTPITVLGTQRLNGTDDDIDSARMREALCLAKKIKTLVDGEVLIRGDANGFRPAAYGDIAVLFRKMTNLPLFESAFRAYGIPYQTIKAGGFYHRYEIADLLHFLAILENPYDEVRIAACLRSPMFGISNDALFYFGRRRLQSKKKISFFEMIRQHESVEELNERDREVVRRFLEVYDFLVIRKDAMGVSDLLEYLLHETRYVHKILLSPEAERKYLNIQKFLEMARNFDSRGSLSLSEFVQYVTMMIEEEIYESEAQGATESNAAIQLMSIHQAKGLEFPIVCIADTGGVRRPPTAEHFRYEKDYGIGSKVWLERIEEFAEDFEALQEKANRKQRERGEELRLLYVAMTRAKDKLVVSGVCNKPQKNPSSDPSKYENWLELLLKYVGFDNTHEETNIEMIEAGVRVELSQNIGDMDLGFSRETELGIRSIAAHNLSILEENQITQQLEVEEVADLPREILFDSLRPISKKDRHYSVTELMALLECPNRYYYRFIKKVPEFLFEVKEGSREGANQPQRNERSDALVGTLFHKLVSEVDLQNIVSDDLFLAASHFYRSLSERQVITLKKALSNFCSGELQTFFKGKNNLTYYKEIPFVISIGKGQVRGQIDLAAVSHEEILILDYKTTAKQMNEESLAAYRDQLLLYSLAFKDFLTKEKYERIRLVLYFPVTDYIHEMSVTIDEIITFEKRVAETIEVAQRMDGPEKSKKTRCQNCQFVFLCEAGEVEMSTTEV